MITNTQIEELIIGNKDLIRTGILKCNIKRMEDYEDFEATVFVELIAKIKKNNYTYYKLLENGEGYFVTTVKNIVKNEYDRQNAQKRNKNNEVLMDEETMCYVC
ncbi:hypothetical protein [Bacillus coahuilensis]|uniref:hypothetical protein n=1 Tax=Bacillus coahuilensis TaxID=408580 RepID=UPI0001851308|nr:hypothetical protein [Bacillus coahuilensis]